MSEFLSQTELHTLTGYARPTSQAAWLKERGIVHKLDNLRLIVMHRHVQAWMEGRHVAFGVFNRSLIK
jgi:hypothetical protein